MSFVVKNTTKWGLLDLICPHTCRGCGALGATLCDCCKNYIIKNHVAICPYCKRTFPIPEKLQPKQTLSATPPNLRLCHDCNSPFLGFWSVSWREGVVAKLVSELKYKSVRANSDILAELLDQSIPTFPPLENPITIIPLPTISKHIRARGLDHTKFIAKNLARRRNWQVAPILTRATNSVQVGTSAAKRHEQASHTYELARKIDPNGIYFLLDDVWTTGASMQAAATILKQAGAKYLYGAVVEISKSSTTDDGAQPLES